MYTLEDVIVDPNKATLKKMYFFGDNPKIVVDHANLKDVSAKVLTNIDPDSSYPFANSNDWYACIVESKEPEDHIIPFDLSDPEDRKWLINCVVIRQETDKYRYCEGIITGFRHITSIDSNYWAATVCNMDIKADTLLEDWTFEDGTPVGKRRETDE